MFQTAKHPHLKKKISRVFIRNALNCNFICMETRCHDFLSKIGSKFHKKHQMLMHYSQGVENFFGNKEDEVGPFPLFLSYELENTGIESDCVSNQYSSNRLIFFAP